MNFYILVSIIIAIFGALNYYIGLRGWQLLGSKLHFLNITVYRVIFAVIVIFCLVGTVVNKLLPYYLRSSFYLLGSYWFAALTYFTVIIVIVDIVRLGDRWLGFLPEGIKNNSAFAIASGVAILISVTVLLVYGTFNAREIKVTPYEVTISKQAGSLNQLSIALISDIHLSNIKDQRLKRIVDTVNGLNPDLVLIAGDIIDDLETFDKRELARDFQKIKSKYGVYASLGNHDYASRDLTYQTKRLREAGINVLRDSSIKLGESFYIIGREDKSYERQSGVKRMDLAKLLEGINRDLPVIMLDHQPINLEEAEMAGVDLQLSGHTHQGQFFPINLITNQVFMEDYGYLKTGNLQVIVSSGAGTWGPPIRIGSSSEVVEITVKYIDQ